MGYFWVDFSGYCKVEANSHEEAETKFWAWYNSLSATGPISDDMVDVDGIEPCARDADC